MREILKQRIMSALDLDCQDISASEAAYYLQKNEDIVQARNHTSSRIAQEFSILGGENLNPDPESLFEESVVFSAKAAINTKKLISGQDREIEYFWFQVGTAVLGAEIEIFTKEVIDYPIPITSDGLFHNARRDRDRFQVKFSGMLAELSQNK